MASILWVESHPRVPPTRGILSACGSPKPVLRRDGVSEWCYGRIVAPSDSFQRELMECLCSQVFIM